MNKRVLSWLVVVFICFHTLGVEFNDFFKDKALRIDMVLLGDSGSQKAAVNAVFEVDDWGGRKHHLNEFHGKGDYRFNIYDNKTGELIYTEGFCTLFREWQTTNEAKVMQRVFQNTLMFPFPKNDVLVEVIARKDGNFTDTLLKFVLDPKSQLVRPLEKPEAKVKIILESGKTEECVDIVLLAEGYAKHEINQFYIDAEQFAKGLFTSAPFKEYINRINIHAIGAVSDEPGVDDPNNNLYVKTALNASYNTLYSDRYLLTTDVKRVNDYACLVPFDQIVILVNTEKYGGGGIYNYYSLNSTRGRSNMQVFIHEFGHSFAGLADEYYTSEVSYSDYFPSHIEPWEPNITTLVNFDSKWKDIISEDTPVPTPVKSKFNKTVGLYEGGGYSAKGIYRPYIDCRMKTNEAEDFCPVCSLEVVKTILFYTGD